MVTELIQKNLKIFHFTTTYSILMKLTTDIILIRSFIWQNLGVCLIGCKMSQKINFLAQIRQFLNTSKNCSISDTSSCLSSLVKNEDCFWGVLAKNSPKSSVKRQFLQVRKNFKIQNWRNADPISVKCAQYVYDLNIFHLL